MSEIAFIVDSCGDVSKELCKENGIYTVPVLLNHEGVEYEDGEAITAPEVYKILENGGFPKTSLPSAERIKATLDEIAQAGYKKVVVVTMSSAISGTWNLFRIICEEYEKLETIVFDSHMASIAEGCLILQIAKEVKEGLTWEKIHERLERLRENTKPFFALDTVEYLEKGGRIGKVTALAGKVLNIKPILSFDEEGVINSYDKVRGRAKAAKRVIEHLIEAAGEHKKYNLVFADGGIPEEREALKKEVREKLPNAVHIWDAQIGCALGVYLGPNLLGAGVQILD